MSLCARPIETRLSGPGRPRAGHFWTPMVFADDGAMRGEPATVAPHGNLVLLAGCYRLRLVSTVLRPVFWDSAHDKASLLDLATLSSWVLVSKDLCDD